MDNNQSSVINNQSTEPIDCEMLWGVPEAELPTKEKPDGLCLFKNIKCDCWDNGCLAGECVKS